MTPLIPPLDPAPVPGPILLFKILLYATFSLHLVFMNLLLGGGLLMTIYAFKGKEKHLDAARSIAKALPLSMPFAISFGVAPLLFVQVLYGPLFYSASIPMAVPFLLIFPVAILAYYAAYILSWKWDSLGAIRPWLSCGFLGLLLYIGFTYSNVFTLMLDPERVKAKYLAHPGGWQMNLAEPSLIARFSHMFIGAVSLAGLYIAYLGLRRLVAEPERGRWMFRSGATWFSGAVILQIVTGLWWLLDLPKEQMAVVLGGSPVGTALFHTGALGSVACLVLVLLTLNRMKPWRFFGTAVALFFFNLLAMVVTRDLIRDAAVEPFLDPFALPTSPQWGVLSLFLLLFVAGLATMGWLLKLATKTRQAPATKAR